MKNVNVRKRAVQKGASESARDLISHLENDLKKIRERAEYWEFLAMTDDLTGLHNRRLLGDMGQHYFDRRNSDHADEMTILFIDLDDFGKLNKKYGDDVGDEALRVLAAGVRKNIRKDDIAIRKGGDEFVIILIGASEQQTNETVLRRIRNMLDGELGFEAAGDRISIRGSVGAFPYNRDETPFENIKRADVLMREQKMLRKKGAPIIAEEVLLQAAE